MSSQAANNKLSLQNLQSCKAAVDAFQAVLEQNKAIAEYNSNQATAAGAAHNAWSLRKQAAQNDFDDWQNTRGNYSQYKDKDFKQDFWSNNCQDRPGGGVCTANVSSNGNMDGDCKNQAKSQNLPYSDGWAATGDRRGCSGGNFWDGCTGSSDNSYSRKQKWLCRRTDDSIRVANAAWQQAKPAAFSEPEPIDGMGDYAHKEPIASAGNVECCANIVNVNGNPSDVAQSCSQQITQIIANLNSNPAPVAAPAPAPAPAPVATPVATSALIANKKIFIGTGIGLILLICLCLCLSLLLATMMSNKQ
jgi:hypothetical protein